MPQFLTYLTLSDPLAITAEAVVSAFRASPAAAVFSIEVDREGVVPGSGFAVKLDGHMPVAVVFVDQALPRDSWEAAVAADIVWPDAHEAMARSRGHVFLAALEDGGGHLEALNRAAGVTLVAAVIAQLLPATGAIFTAAQTVTAADSFIAQAMTLAEKVVPTGIWIGKRFLRGETPGTTAMLTTGLVPFIGREIEFLPAPLPPMEIAKRVIGLCQYLIVNGPVIGDGETVGLTKDEKIRVEFAAQGQRPGVPVLQLAVAAAA